MDSSIRAVFKHGQLQLLDPIDLQDGETVEITILREQDQPASGVTMTARQLLKASPAVRSAYLRRAAERASKDYESNSELRGFDAFGDQDFYDETP